MRKNLFLFTLIFMLSLTSSAWAARTLTVGGSINDPSNDIYSSITNALISADILAEEYDAEYAEIIIAFNPTTYNMNTKDGGSVTLSGYDNLTSVTIGDGSSVTINYPHFIISDTRTFAFNSLTLTNSTTGAISVSSGTVNITGTTFSSNASTSNGGALNITGGTVTINGSTFSDNSASGNGGAVYISSGTVTLSGTNTFSGNTAGSSGGAIYTSVSLTFSSPAEFSGNTATSDGGALYISGGTIAFSDTANFDGNTATSNGGAIYVSEGTVNLSSTSTFTGNTGSTGGAVYNAGTMTFAGKATFSGANNASDGGALYNSGTMTFSESPSFESNYATSNGGAIYLEGGTLTFSAEAAFKTNYAASDGGAIYAASGTLEAGSVTLTFTGNYSESYGSSTSESSPIEGGGGAVCITGAVVNLGEVTIGSHSATYGGAIYIEGGELNVSGTASFTKNNAYYGGALYIAGGTTTFEGSVTFTSNTAKNDGGALYVASDASGTSLNFANTSSVTFTTNQANSDKGSLGNGGAVYWGTRADYFASTFNSLTSASFTDNSALSANTNPVTFTATAGNGGAVYCSGSGTLTINGSTAYTFSGNTASSNGGAIFTTIAKIVIRDIDITLANSAEYGGGGFAETSSGDITVTNASISNQEADKGGALYAEGMTITSADFSANTSGTGGGGAVATFYKLSTGQVTITDSTFTANETEGKGGAVLARTANFSITNSFFGTNKADDNGGAIDIGGQSTTNIMQSTFTTNEGKSGGAIYADGVFRIRNPRANINNQGLCYFIDNHAEEFGGAIHYDQRNGSGEFVLHGSFFHKNAATKGSGGAVNVASDVAEIESCTFDTNSSGTDTNSVGGFGGGAVFMFISGNNVSKGTEAGLIQNCTFVRNQVNGGGSNSCGGALSVLSVIKVRSCTFSLSNSVTTYGGAIFVGNNATLHISGTIAVGNSAKNGGDIYKGDGANITTGGYNRIGIYGTGGNNTGWKTDVGVESDRESTAWTKADFFSDNDLADNIRSDTVPPTVGSTRGTVARKRLQTLMLKEAESLALDDRATTIIPYTLRYNFPQFDERGVDRRELGTNIDIGAVFFDGTVKGDGENENSSYSIAGVSMSGVPNSMKALGQTASLLAVIRYTNGRSAYAGNGSNQEKVTWASLPEGNNIIKITTGGVITAIGEGTAYITVTTNRAKQDGTYATDTQAVKVNRSALLNLAPEFFDEFNNFLENLYEYDMSVALAEPRTSVITSSGFQSSFKSKWSTSASAIVDMSEVYPDFSLKKTSEYKANTTLYLAAAQAQRPGINVSLPERTAGDLLALTYSWNLKAQDISSLLGDDYELGDINAQLASDLFTALSINITTAANKNINVVNADNAKDLFNSGALVLSKSDSNNGVHIELTAYLAHADYSGTGNAPQLVNNLLIVPDDSVSDDDDTLSATMWLAQGTTSGNDNSGSDNTNSGGGSGGGGGGCSSLELGIIAAGLVFALKRR